MPNAMIKRGSQDNIVTYQHVCDATEDMQNINPAEITLGSTCIVLEGESGGLEVYMAKSNKQWVLLSGGIADEVTENNEPEPEEEIPHEQDETEETPPDDDNTI